MRAFVLAALIASTATAAAQAPTTAYPVKPVPLPDAEEIALAVSAAPADLSANATVYAVRDGKVLTLRAGTNGSSCMVARDQHGGSLYPICYNPEGTRTVLKRELMEVRLRTLGVTEDSIAFTLDFFKDSYEGDLEPDDVADLSYLEEALDELGVELSAGNE